MGGGLLQLVAYGAQDAYLSGNPQITFWRGMYKRHTNFAMEPFRVNLTGQATWGTKHSAILTRYADLVSCGYIELELKAESAGVNLLYSGKDRRAGFNLIDYVELDIGGQIIDRQYGEFMYLWSTIAMPYEQTDKLDYLTSAQLADNGTCGASGRPFRTNLTYIPLLFWFCKNPASALPLIALQYHEVKINILWNKAKQIFSAPPSTALSAGPAQANLLLDYIYLDVDERRRMAQDSHEYLIEQLQFNEDKGITSAQNRIDLTFNHPVKELIWVTQYSWRRNCNITPPSSYSVSPLSYDDLIYNCNLQINGQDRMESLPGTYFSAVQRYQHHSGGASDDGAGTGGGAWNWPGYTTLPGTGGIYMYSFAIRPEEHQPSGTCNFSRIDTATLVFSVDGAKPIGNNVPVDTPDNAGDADIRVYAINYNILRVMSGMGGLSFSN